MKNIRDYSDEEYLRFWKTFSRKKTYLDKVKFIYENTGFVKGKDSREINGENIVISLEPPTPEDNIKRWMFYVEVKYNEELMRMRTDIFTRYDKIQVEDRRDFIDAEIKILNIQKNSGLRNWGFDIESRGIGYEQFNFDSTLVSNHLFEIACGRAIHSILKELNAEKQIVEDDEKEVGNEKKMKMAHLVGMIHALGIVKHLKDNFPSLENHNARTIGVLSEICGIEVSSKEWRTFNATMKKFMNREESSSTAINEIRSRLLKYGIHLKDDSKKR